jgi:hypothetical protein
LINESGLGDFRMDKVIVKYSKITYLSLLLYGLVVGFASILSGLMMINSSGSEGAMYALITIFLSCLLIFGELYLYGEVTTKIILDDNGLTVNRLFKKYNFRWDEISEFGKSRYLFRSPNKSMTWFYYIKSSSTGGERIFLGSLELNNITTLCDVIFKKAVNAKFVILENTSNIPFVRKFTPVEWNHREGSKETFFGTKE